MLSFTSARITENADFELRSVSPLISIDPMLVSKDDSSIVLYDLCGSLNNRHLNLLKMVNSGSLEGMLNLH